MEFRLKRTKQHAALACGTSVPALTAGIEDGSRDFRLFFRAMATPCEIRVECGDRTIAERAARAALAEARRIEAKFSRYLDGSVVGRINARSGHPTEVDAETAHLLNFAQHLFQISSGLFDITSGVLRRIWRFDGSDRIPADEQVNALLPLVGWQKAVWNPPILQIPAGAEIDFGGLGKEYAVDLALHCLTEITS